MNSYDLPADVFEAGETKPTRKSKVKTVKNGDLSSKKRTFSATQMDVRSHLLLLSTFTRCVTANHVLLNL